MWKACSVGANHLMPGSPAYQAKPTPDHTWHQLQDMGVPFFTLEGGQEGNRLHAQCNENHPHGRSYDPNWAQNLQAFLDKVEHYGFKVVFHSMGRIYGTLFGLVEPMFANSWVNPYSSVANALRVVEKLGGDNALGKNFFRDPRVLWWSPINEAYIDGVHPNTGERVADWLRPIVDSIKNYGGKVSMCIRKSGYSYREFSQAQRLFNVDYLQSHAYHYYDTVDLCDGNPSRDMYPLAYNAFLGTCQIMNNEKGPFPLSKVFLTEFGCGSFSWSPNGTTTAQQQKDYIRGVYEAAREVGIGGILYWAPWQIDPDWRHYGFIDYNGTPNPQSVYDYFKSLPSNGPPTPTSPILAIAGPITTAFLLEVLSPYL